MKRMIDGIIKDSCIKPCIEGGTLFFPISVEVEKLDKYNGDARSFGYNQDDGTCSTIEFEPVFGVLAEDTVELIQDAHNVKNSIRKIGVYPTCDEDEKNTTVVSESTAKFILKDEEDELYQDKNGYFYIGKGWMTEEIPVRLTDESVAIYLHARQENTRKVKKYNEINKNVDKNIEILKSTSTAIEEFDRKQKAVEYVINPTKGAKQ